MAGRRLAARPAVIAATDAAAPMTQSTTAAAVPSASRRAACLEAAEALDAALCRLGVLARTPKRGMARRLRVGRLSPAELVGQSDIWDRFRAVTVLYLEAYTSRIGDVYTTLRHKAGAMAHFWRFIDEHHPAVRSCAELTPAKVREFVPHAIERACSFRRPADDGGHRMTAHAWLTDVLSLGVTLALGVSPRGRDRSS